MSKKPIGVFDSGVGGLTVVKKLTEVLPNENIIYLGDTARVPYGNKSKETVTRFAVECIMFLEKFNIKLLVVACNTVSSWSLKTLKRVFSVPIIGVIEPAVKESCSKTKRLRIGVIGTKATVTSGSYPDAINKIDGKIKVYQKACPLFVPLVEENWLRDKSTFDIAAKYLKPLKEKGIDTLILGCTHYPLLKDVFRAYFGDNVNIIDSSLGVSEEIKSFLERKTLINESKKRGKIEYFVTDDPDSFKKVSNIFLNKGISVKKVNLK